MPSGYKLFDLQARLHQDNHVGIPCEENIVHTQLGVFQFRPSLHHVWSLCPATYGIWIHLALADDWSCEPGGLPFGLCTNLPIPSFSTLNTICGVLPGSDRPACRSEFSVICWCLRCAGEVKTRLYGHTIVRFRWRTHSNPITTAFRPCSES